MAIDDYAKTVDQEQPDFYFVFTMILCGSNILCLVRFEVHFDKLASCSFWEPFCLI